MAIIAVVISGFISPTFSHVSTIDTVMCCHTTVEEYIRIPIGLIATIDRDVFIGRIVSTDTIATERHAGRGAHHQRYVGKGLSLANLSSTFFVIRETLFL